MRGTLRSRAGWIAVGTLAAVLCMGASQCQLDDTPQSTSGVTKATARVNVGGDGLTAEQRNIRDRLVEDNKPGAIKHLYVISPYSGQVIIYSTVRGKVTSGGKRLTPDTVSENYGVQCHGFKLDIGGSTVCTQEVLQDDGAYGHTGEYIFWWDVQGRYHQHYLGNEILHITDQPLPVKSIMINVSANSD